MSAMDHGILADARGQRESNLPRMVCRQVRRFVLKSLAEVAWGVIRIRDVDGQVHQLGADGNPGPRTEVRVHHLDFWGYVGMGGSVGAGQSYFMGIWDCDELTDLVRILVHNRHVLDAMDTGIAFLTRPFYKLLHWRRENTLEGSQANIAAHYDIGNDFYALMLDNTMMYSCAVFDDAERTSLYDAQVAKLDLICEKLGLQPGMRVMEIGTGWGGFAVHAAERFGVHVTTTTISREQHAWAERLVRERGLEDQVTLLFQDYRALDGHGSFDRVVSIEMIEAVGHRYLPTYFQTISQLLKPDGAALVQAITIEDYRFEAYKDSVDFINRYIFPGGCLPSITAMLDAASATGDLKMVHLDDIGPHYAETLKRWREACEDKAADIDALGYPEAFRRMWRYYLCYCEGGFRERSIGDVHVLLSKPDWRGALPVASASALTMTAD